jgi:hypothetical protein
MLSKREQDSETAVHFRSDRVCRINGVYFFSTRENTLEGPYLSREGAERESLAYILRLQTRNATRAEPSSSSRNG